MRQRGAAVVAALLVSSALSVVAPLPGRAATGTTLSQWIAKTHTEAFGRLPTQAEWQADVNYFAGAGCTTAALAERGRARYTSSEFLALPYTPPPGTAFAVVRLALGAQANVAVRWRALDPS